MSFKIGNVEIENKVILAPMAGITSFSYRKFMKQFGVSLTYTEMISDCGLIYNNNKTFDLLKSDNSDRPLALQLFGGSKETIIKAIKILESSNFEYDILDLNLACPVPKVVKNNGGSSWLKDLDKLKEMLINVVKASKKPVSIKIRLGYNEVNVEKVCKIAEEAGVSFIAIHARTKKEMYSGEPHFELLKNIKDIISIPFAVSGNIFTVGDALNAFKITRCDAIMIARGGIGNPELISNILSAIDNKNYSEELDFNRQKLYLFEYMDSLKEEYGEKKAVSVLKGIAPKFFQHLKDSKKLRSKITLNANTIGDIKKSVEEFEIEREDKCF